MSLQGSPKKKLVERLLSGMSPGRRKTSSSQFTLGDYPHGGSDNEDKEETGSVLSRRSSLYTAGTSDYCPEEKPMLSRPTSPEELERMFREFLAETNLGSNERMLSLGVEEKWKLIQAQARAEAQSEPPMAIIDRMSSIALKLESKRREESGLVYLEKGILDGLRVSFRTASVSWLQTFVENGGSELMVQIMRQIYPERDGGPKVVQMIETVRTFSNCPFGIDCFVYREGLLDTLILFLTSQEHRIRSCVVHILTAIAYMNVTDGPFRILEAFNALKAEMEDDGRFDTLLSIVSSQCRVARKSPDPVKREQATKFVSDCLIFLNVLMEDLGDFNLRVALRAELLRQPFKREFDRLEELGLGHQKEMFMSAAQVDQMLFNEMLQESGVTEIVPKEGCSADIFQSLHDSLMNGAAQGDGEMSRLLMMLLMVPDGQLRADHLKLLRKVLEATLFSGMGLKVDLQTSPVPLIGLEEFISCLVPIDQRSRTKETVDQLKRSLEETRKAKEALEANLDEQMNRLRLEYENQIVKLKIDFGDVQKECAVQRAEIETTRGERDKLEEQLQKEKEEIVRIKLEQLASPAEEVPSKPINAKADEDLGKARTLTPPPLPPTLAARPPPPPPPPLPAGLQRKDVAAAQPLPPQSVAQGVLPPSPPMPPVFLKSQCVPAPPPPPPFLKRAAPGVPAPPPPPPFMMGPGAPPSPPFMASAPPMAVDMGVFPDLPKPKGKLKALAIDKLSKLEAEGTLWPRIDTKKIPALFDLGRLDDLLDASRLDNRQSVSTPQDSTLQENKPVMFDPKHSKNLSIMLRGLKISDEEILEKIQRTSEDLPAPLVYSLGEISRILPDAQIQPVLAYMKGNKQAKLDRPELIFVQLHQQVPEWRERLALLRVKHVTQELVYQLRDQLKPLEDVCGVLKDAHDLFNTLGAILYLANYINQGTHRGNAYGFRVSSAKSVTAARTTQKDYSVLDYLTESVTKSGWLAFPKRVEDSIQVARKIPLAEVEKVLEALKALEAELGVLMESGIAKEAQVFGKQITKHIDQAKTDIAAVSSDLKACYGLFAETYDRANHEPVLTALLELCQDIEAAKKALVQREAEAEQKARRLAQAKPRQRSLISKEHKHGCIDNIMDKLRQEIKEAAGKPSLKQ